MKELCEPSANRWVFKAIAYKSARSRGFVGYGDADPSNVSSLVHGAAMRVAETRAANHALRKAYGIGLCSLEELEWSPRPLGPDRPNQTTPPTNGNNGHHNGQPRLRDQLCLLIRKHKLDAGLVRAYAADYCGTPALRDASRTQIESFGKLNWFLRDFGYDTDLLGRDEIDERALLGYAASYRSPTRGSAAAVSSTSNGSPPLPIGKKSPRL